MPTAAKTHGDRLAHDAAERTDEPLFEATVQATEEAIINALVAAETMTGVNGHTRSSLYRTTGCGKFWKNTTDFNEVRSNVSRSWAGDVRPFTRRVRKGDA